VAPGVGVAAIADAGVGVAATADAGVGVATADAGVGVGEAFVSSARVVVPPAKARTATVPTRTGKRILWRQFSIVWIVI
jgi:hypothetical protein